MRWEFEVYDHTPLQGIELIINRRVASWSEQGFLVSSRPVHLTPLRRASLGLRSFDWTLVAIGQESSDPQHAISCHRGINTLFNDHLA